MSSQNNSSTWCSMPRSTNRPVQCRLHGRPPVRFLRRFSVPSVQRVSLRGNPDPGRLSHAHSKPPPGQQEVSSALRAPARRRGGQGQGEARSWRWKEQAGHGSWSGNLRRSEGEAGAEFVDEESILVPPGHGISEVRRFGSFCERCVPSCQKKRTRMLARLAIVVDGWIGAEVETTEKTN
jgi:hypothetical protein